MVSLLDGNQFIICGAVPKLAKDSFWSSLLWWYGPMTVFSKTVLTGNGIRLNFCIYLFVYLFTFVYVLRDGGVDWALLPLCVWSPENKSVAISLLPPTGTGEST